MCPEELSLHVINPETYVKWKINADGDRYLKGSTTKLTKHGFSVYLEQIYAFGAELGVQFGVKE